MVRFFHNFEYTSFINSVSQRLQVPFKNQKVHPHESSHTAKRRGSCVLSVAVREGVRWDKTPGPGEQESAI